MILFTMPSLTDLLITLGIGLAAGLIASFVMNTKGGLIRNIIIGIIGGFVGRFILQLVDSIFGLHIGASNIIGTILVSAAGACILVWVAKKLFK